MAIRTPPKAGPSKEQKEQKSSKVRKSIEDFERGKSSSPLHISPPKKTAAPALVAASSKPKPRAAVKQPADGSGSPPPRPAYANRVAEARACLNRAKLHLSNSRNTKTEIKEGVIAALDRLYQLVKESETATAAQLRDRPEGRLVVADVGPNPKPTGVVGNEREWSERQGDRVTPDERAILGQQEKILEKLEENNKILKENREKIERLGSLVEGTTTATKSYAGVAAAGVSKRPPEAKALHSVVVSSTNELETGEEVLDKIRKKVDAKDGWVRVERVRKMKDRKVIVGCATVEEREKVKKRLKGTPELNVEDMRNKDPLLIFRDVLNYNEDEEVLRALKNQNKHVLGSIGESERRMKIVYRKRARNPHQCHIVARVSPQVWAGFLQERAAYIDLQKVGVADESPLVQCSRCLGYGHTKRYCKETEESCSHCGGPHKRTECQQWLQREPPRCCNCTRAGIDNVEHGAFEDQCPIRRKWDSLARAAIAYC